MIKSAMAGIRGRSEYMQVRVTCSQNPPKRVLSFLSPENIQVRIIPSRYMRQIHTTRPIHNGKEYNENCRAIVAAEDSLWKY